MALRSKPLARKSREELYEVARRLNARVVELEAYCDELEKRVIKLRKRLSNMQGADDVDEDGR